MEKIEGLDLEQWMHNRSHQPITSEQALEWLTQVTQILDQVHQQDYFHRDIKPPNIMRRPNGQLVLIDFGTAREVTGTYLAKIGGSQNVTGIVSVGYTPPEQAAGRAVPQSDFFALGRTFVYLLTGKHPNDLLEDPRTGELLWRETGSCISKALGDLIDYMMAPFPGNRPQNTQVILDILAELERTWNSPHSTFEYSQEPTLQVIPSNLPKPSESIPSQSISTNQSTQQPLIRKFDSSKWLAGGTVLLMGLGGIGYWQFTQKPLSSTPTITNTSSLPPAVTNTSPSPPATTNTSPSPSATTNTSSLSPRNSSKFPAKSQAGGVTLEVLSVKQQGEKLLLNVKLKNEGTNSVRFDDNSWNVTDDQNRALLATPDGLPQELPAGKGFSGTVSVPTFSLMDAKTLSLTLTDALTRTLQLTISHIPVTR